MSSSSFESQRSIRSSTSIQSAASYKSGMSFSIDIDIRFLKYGLIYNLPEILFQFHILAASNSSWFSIGSFSNFQAGGIVDPRAMNRAPRVSSFCNTVRHTYTYNDSHPNTKPQSLNNPSSHFRPILFHLVAN